MKLDERLALINAGYTKEEIAAFETEETPAPAPAPAAAPEQKQEDKPAPEPEQKPAPEQTPAPAPAQDPILEALNRLTNTIIKQNINGTVIQPAERSPEDALAEVIAPPKKTK